MVYYTLLVFAPLLIVIGTLGFLIPAEKAVTSGAPAYNLFHIGSGMIGILILLFGEGNAAKIFLVAFGAMDIYQAAASMGGLFPIKYFRWKRLDDVLHIVIGVALIVIGAFG